MPGGYDVILRALVVLLSLTGLADSLYFTFAYYGRVKKARWIPEILCAREGSSCVTVVQTPYARVFGVPNSLLGIFYYLAVIVWALAYPWLRFRSLGFGEFRVYFNVTTVLAAVSILTVALGLYLIDALVRKLRVHCPMCYLGHAINALILILLIMLG